MATSKALYEDEHLFNLLTQSDQDAFTQIYNKYYSMLYALSYRYLKEREPAEDVVQQVYLRLWESRASCRIAVSLKNYLYTMTKNQLLNTIRDKNDLIVKQHSIFLQHDDFADSGLQEKLEEEKKFSHFYCAIKKLPNPKRKICLLKIYQGMNNQQIAEKLNMPVGTVKNYYSQSILLLKHYIKQQS